MYNMFAVGKSIYLRHPTEKDVRGKWHEWMSDPAVTRFLVQRNWPNSLESQLDYYNSLKDDRSKLVLAIVDKATETHIGICSLSGIDHLHRFCDFALIIGEEEYRRGGLAVDAMGLLLEVAFNRLNIRKVRGGHVGTNDHTSMLLKFFNFKIIGRFEELFWVDGQYEDLVLSVLDRKDWQSRC